MPLKDEHCTKAKENCRQTTSTCKKQQEITDLIAINREATHVHQNEQIKITSNNLCKLFQDEDNKESKLELNVKDKKGEQNKIRNCITEKNNENIIQTNKMKYHINLVECLIFDQVINKVAEKECNGKRSTSSSSSSISLTSKKTSSMR